MLCLFSCIAVDDDIDDFDDLTSISKIMNILCYLSWSVDFSTNNDGDKNDDDDNDDDNNNNNDDDVSTVYATDYSIANIYLLIYHPKSCRKTAYNGFAASVAPIRELD